MVDFAKLNELTKYRKLLAWHDWAYEYSDDHSVWIRGRQELAVLREMQSKLDPDCEIWNELCQNGYERKTS